METITIRYSAPVLDEAFYEVLYDEVYPVIASLIGRQGGSRADAEDIFQDAVLLLLDMSQRGEIRDHRKYLVGIAKHLWLRRARGTVRHLALDDFEQSLSVPDAPSDEGQDALLHLLQRTGSKCLDLLSDFYFAGLTIADVAARHGFTNVHSASVQKHKCVEKLRTIVREKSYRYEDFVE